MIGKKSRGGGKLKNVKNVIKKLLTYTMWLLAEFIRQDFYDRTEA